MNKLTVAEKEVIQKLNHKLYTVNFVEEWVTRPAENVFINAPAALQQAMVEGFIEAVRAIVKQKGDEYEI